MRQTQNRNPSLTFLLCILLILSCFAPACGQRLATLSGVVQRPDGSVVPGASIQLRSTIRGGITNEQGQFSLPHLPPASYTLIISHVGYASVIETLRLLPGQHRRLTTRLTPAITELNTVAVQGQSEAGQLRNSPQAIAVVDARKFYSQSFSLNEVLNRVPGVRIRQEGGLGSNATVSINGIGGKQVKFFLDGITLFLFSRSPRFGDHAIRRFGATGYAKTGIAR